MKVIPLIFNGILLISTRPVMFNWLSLRGIRGSGQPAIRGGVTAARIRVFAADNNHVYCALIVGNYIQMRVTLLFPTYTKLSDFLTKVGTRCIELDLKMKSLTADFNQQEVTIAMSEYQASRSTTDNREERGADVNH
jgi:hypothetical protein